MFANCGLPYHIAGEIEDRAKLLIMTPEKMWARSRVQVHVNHEVVAINRGEKTIRVRKVDGSEEDFAYDKLILSQGAKPVVPPIPGADLPNVFTLRDVPDMDRIIAFVDGRSPKTAAIIGGGFIGLEMAEAFHRRGMKVTIIEKLPHILPLLDGDMALHLQNRIRGNDFAILTGAEAQGFSAEGVQLAGGPFVPAELILLSVGVRAEVESATAGGAGDRRDGRGEGECADGVQRHRHLCGGRCRRNHAHAYRRADARISSWLARQTGRDASPEPTRRAGGFCTRARWVLRLCVFCT